jgi:catechol 2,3-dioxygenase-like lactoylglutathione lyase family enzyme
MGALTKACPVLAARDIEASLDWYREVLGFSARLVRADYGIAERDGIEVHFWQCDDRHVAENTSAYFRVAGVDELFSSLGRAGEAGRVNPVADHPWGMREFSVIDPDGNLLRFGEPAADRAVA